MLKAQKPDPVAASFRLHMIFPRRGEALITVLQKENRGKKLLPDWREAQIVKMINAINLFAADLNDRYRAQRIDAVANTTRNLLELGIWTQYCNMSEQNAKRFYEDSVRDFREVLETIQKLYTHENGKPEDVLSEIINKFQNLAATHGIKDFDARYVQVRDAAKEIARLEVFSTLYKIFSKLAHPTSLILALDPNTKGLPEMLDALYVGGEDFAVRSLHEIEKFIEKTYPSLIMNAMAVSNR